MAESRVIVNRPNSSSPPPNCAICLGTCTNKCFSDSCMHQFCFKCLLEWSKEYDEHVVEITPPEEIHIMDNEEFLVLPLTPSSHTRHQFHFRNMYHRRRRDNTSTSFRRSIYMRNLWVNAPPDVTGRYRDVSPSFFRSCPGARTRLVPWLNRELNALLYENTRLVMRLVDVIMDRLLRYHICSRTFRNLLYEYLLNKTAHFVHEFYNFMRSPFDMIGYDRHVVYTERPQSPAPYIDVSDNDDDDSDVIIVGATNPEEPVVIDLVNTDSDEPILVSQEEPQLPLPIPERCAEPERRTPVLPLKLRLKHKRQTREKEKRLRQKRKFRRHRSRSSSSTASSSSSESTESSKSSHKRYKRRKKHKKASKKREHPLTTSESSTDLENTDSESADDLPLSTFARRKKHTKKVKKRDRSYKTSKHSDYSSMSGSVKEPTKKDSDRERQDDSNLPGCSRYSSDSCPRSPFAVAPNNEDSSGSANAPTCSKYAYSPYTSEQEGTTSSNVNSEVREVRPEEKNGGPSGSGNGRLRNILIKKEGSSNMWYSYPCKAGVFGIAEAGGYEWHGVTRAPPRERALYRSTDGVCCVLFSSSTIVGYAKVRGAGESRGTAGANRTVFRRSW
ncbi:hypothetical protein NQ318_017540 [Aromia moschata]|uniref:RING-type E3 ubiquitin transferase n=1 Tax=Aromia moschata TaxID=1265417 RepID=A0AAV8Z0U1_9CUCU|nr:hypothetical protein NQ318_017540 [Aromia moschata]